MIRFWVDLIVLLLGYGAAALLYFRIPFLPRGQVQPSMRLSVIIPARNEEQTLPLLLGDLLQQTIQPHEILVVNDVLGLSGDFKPKFVKVYADLGKQISAAAAAYQADVAGGAFPGPEHCYE